ncbi:hypothetical protein IHQ71_10665 [Rhizobium sp. TH2]|uniref:hypothetical protein n=1 Tax=Rhizobium sp. TH2 TaxID=2775403 RepID=UPI002158374D|nr:hypothetical protein [Rhizobium sp. TH2]UVC10996.1 hypothetical protein IHQ71_10665 [Rhizobium sp. TH2]
MAARVYGIIVATAVACGAGWWTWSQYCEQYGLCYPACRVASNGVESWKRLSPVIRQSEQITAAASPGSECLALLDKVRTEYPGKDVVIDTVNMAGARKPALHHRYDCTFQIREPVFYLGRNAECAVMAP